MFVIEIISLMSSRPPRGVDVCAIDSGKTFPPFFTAALLRHPHRCRLPLVLRRKGDNFVFQFIQRSSCHAGSVDDKALAAAAIDSDISHSSCISISSYAVEGESCSLSRPIPGFAFTISAPERLRILKLIHKILKRLRFHSYKSAESMIILMLSV